MANAPESSDSSFTWEAFAGAVNKDLADTFGNFVNRCLTFTERAVGPQVPGGGDDGEPEAVLVAELTGRVDAYGEHLADRQFRKATAELRAVWAAGNAYWEQSEPWKVVKADPDRAAVVMRTGVNLVRLFALLATPIIPASAAQVLDAVTPGLPVHWPDDVAGALHALEPGAAFTVPDVLFRKITDDDIAAWTARFGGPEEAKST
jgi:methionyl-tRNA synthetase